MAYAYSGDVEAVWRPLTDVEILAAETLAGYASTLLDRRFGVDERIADGSLDESLATLATVQMVKRVLVNPDAVRQMTQSAGPYSSNRTFTDVRHELAITDAEVRLLAPGKSPPRSIRTTPALWGSP